MPGDGPPGTATSELLVCDGREGRHQGTDRSMRPNYRTNRIPWPTLEAAAAGRRAAAPAAGVPPVLLPVVPPVLPKVPASVLPPVLRGSCRGCHECGGRCIAERRRSRDVTVLTPGDGPPGAATSAMTKIEPRCREAEVRDRDAVCKAPWCCDTKGTPTPKGVAGSTTSERDPGMHFMACGAAGAGRHSRPVRPGLTRRGRSNESDPLRRGAAGREMAVDGGTPTPCRGVQPGKSNTRMGADARPSGCRRECNPQCRDPDPRRGVAGEHAQTAREGPSR
jgi:hypothetical protein